MLHLGIIIGICISIVVVGLIFTLNKQSIMGTTNIQDNSEINTIAPDCKGEGPGTTMPISQWLEGKQVTTPKEALLVGQSIKLPKYLPAGYDIEKIAVTEKRVTILASKFPITSSLTNMDFIYQDRGISIYFDNVPSDQEANEIRQPVNQPEWKLVDIGDKKGLGHEIIRSLDPKDHGCTSAELIFYIGNNTRNGLVGLTPLSELAKIATSF